MGIADTTGKLAIGTNDRKVGVDLMIDQLNKGDMLCRKFAFHFPPGETDVVVRWGMMQQCNSLTCGQKLGGWADVSNRLSPCKHILAVAMGMLGWHWDNQALLQVLHNADETSQILMGPTKTKVEMRKYVQSAFEPLVVNGKTRWSPGDYATCQPGKWYAAAYMGSVTQYCFGRCSSENNTCPKKTMGDSTLKRGQLVFLTVCRKPRYMMAKSTAQSPRRDQLQMRYKADGTSLETEDKVVVFCGRRECLEAKAWDEGVSVPAVGHALFSGNKDVHVMKDSVLSEAHRRKIQTLGLRLQDIV